MKQLLTAALLLTLPVHADADDITDALDNARQAYADGDVQYAIEELDFARQKLLALKTDALSAYLPDAPDGWTREINLEMNAGMAMMGGGVGAEAEYSSPDGTTSFTLTMMADNPMIASMAGMLANAGAMGIRVERIGRQKFMVQDQDLTGIVANRILIQTTGADEMLMMKTLKNVDFAALGNFGS